MKKQIDVWNIIGILLSIILVIISPNIPQLSITIRLITLSSLIVLLILIIVYLNTLQKIKNIEDKNKNLFDSLHKIKNEIKLLEENFNVAKDLIEMKTQLDYLERRIFKR